MMKRLSTITACLTMLMTGGTVAAHDLKFDLTANPLDYDRDAIDVTVTDEDGRRVQKFRELSTDQKKMLGSVLGMIRRPNDYPGPRVASHLTFDGGEAEGVGCGFNSTDAEPFQAGCWIGDTLCYISFDGDDWDAGCQSCGGDCPPD